MRKQESLPTLAANGQLVPNSVIVVNPAFLPPGADPKDPRFRATVVNSYRRGEIRWHADGQLYSLTGLTRELSQNHGVQWPDKTCLNWCREGQPMSIWDEAEQYPR
jgi:hypothetical protein